MESTIAHKSPIGFHPTRLGCKPDVFPAQPFPLQPRNGCFNHRRSYEHSSGRGPRDYEPLYGTNRNPHGRSITFGQGVDPLMARPWSYTPPALPNKTRSSLPHSSRPATAHRASRSEAVRLDSSSSSLTRLSALSSNNLRS